MYNQVIVLLVGLILTCDVESQRVGRHKNRLIRRSQESRKLGECLFNICEQVDNYPENSIKRILQKNKALHSYFGNIIEPSVPVSLDGRFGGPDYQPFCKTVDVTVFPKFMRDIDDVARPVVNIDGYHQVLKLQTCDLSNGEKCFAGRLLDRPTKCLQKFNVVKLMALNMDNKTLEYRKFKLPSTCVCTYADDEYEK